MTNIKERVLEVSSFKGSKKEIFFKGLGFSYANFKGIQKKSALNSDSIDKILTKYPDISPIWLISGSGSMLKEAKPYIPNHLLNLETPLTKEDNNGIPLIPVEAMAGWGQGDVAVMNYEAETYRVPEFDKLKVDFMIKIKGSSMYPKYNSGDTVACRKIELGSFFQWNKVYVLDTSQGPMIKRIHPSEKSESIKCISDNEKYLPFDLPLDDLYSLALVIGVIRLE